MNTFNISNLTAMTQATKPDFVVVHPLDDAPEQKANTAQLGAMPMTATVKASLMVLRGYLVLMTLLVLYHVMDLAGAFGHAH